jgi:endonuclease YncB( thermonuclease family)
LGPGFLHVRADPAGVGDNRARLVRVNDGDTIVVVLDQGFRDTKEIDVRLASVYCPEGAQPGYLGCAAFSPSRWRDLHPNDEGRLPSSRKTASDLRNYCGRYWV